MEFGFTSRQEALRKEIEDYYLEQLPEDYTADKSSTTEEQHAFWRALQKRAGEKRYLTPGWPEEYGGMGLDTIEQGIVHDVEGEMGIHWPAGAGLRLAGPATILFGTDEQKARVIPPIARGESVWFQAFTEPEAGSDEANVQLRAIEDGDDFILNGQKTFISGIHKPDYLYTLTRTADVAPKHRGISLFLIPADTPGISYHPQPSMGGSPQNNIFFNDVRVSKGALLGELNKGFYHAMATFEFERSGTNYLGSNRRALLDFVLFCKEETKNGKPLIDDPAVSRDLAQMAVDLQVQELVTWHTIWWFTQRERLGPKPYDLSAFFLKQFNTSHNKIMMRILGAYGQLQRSSRWAKMSGLIESQWQRMRTWHAGGTVEIYKIIVAARGLGLPRAARPTSKTQ
ncbi:MAG: acyl-CoA dehydrogenase family protein [Dehalococcoidia bacterium]